MLFALSLVTWPLSAFGVVKPLVPTTLAEDGGLLAAVIACASAFLLTGQARAKRSLSREALVVPASLGLFFGLSIGCALSALAAFVRTSTRFDRTPKGGAPARALYPTRVDAVAVLELVTSVVYSALTALALTRGEWAHAAFSGAVAAVFAWIAGSVLLEALTQTSHPNLTPAPAHARAPAPAPEPALQRS